MVAGVRLSSIFYLGQSAALTKNRFVEFCQHSVQEDEAQNQNQEKQYGAPGQNKN